MLLGRQQKVTGWNLVNAVVQRSHLHRTERYCVIDALFIPARGHAGGEQGLDLRCEIKRVAVPGIEQRLDAEPVPRSEDPSPVLVPQRQCKLTTQMLQTLRAEIFIQVQRNLAVRARAQPV